MSTVDKNVHTEEKIINEPTAAPTTANPVAECEMDALLLGRIGVNLFFFITSLIVVMRYMKSLKCEIVIHYKFFRLHKKG